MAPGRVRAGALAADVVAVLAFAALGRASHGQPAELSGYLGTVAPFLVGLLAAWLTPVVRAEPTSFRAGGVVLLAAAVGGLLLRAAFTGRLPLSFFLVATSTMAMLLLGWRGVTAVVARLRGARGLAGRT